MNLGEPPTPADSIGQPVSEVAALRAQLAHLQNTLRQALHHDLPAPVRHIAGFVQVIEEDYGAVLPPEVAEHLQTISSAAVQLRTQLASLAQQLSDGAI